MRLPCLSGARSGAALGPPVRSGVPASTSPDLPPPGPVPCVLDTDTFNEVDDQFALAWMLRRPDRFDLRAVTAAPFLNGLVSSPAEGMRLSAEEARRVAALCGREEVPVVEGAERFSGGGVVESPAVERILELSREVGAGGSGRTGGSGGGPLHVVAIGALTNVASALWKDPTLRERIVLHWLGGHTPPHRIEHEFNHGQDTAAGDAAFGGVPLVWSPCKNVASHLLTTAAELERDFEPRGPLAAFLTGRVREHLTTAGADGPPPAAAKEIWDLCPVAWLLGGEEMVETAEAPNPLGGAPIRSAIYVRRNAVFARLFDDLAG